MDSKLVSLSALVALAALAGCAPDGQPRTAEASPAAEVAVQELVVDAGDFYFEAPASVPAGMTRIRLVNVGPEFHHVQLVRIDDGYTIDDFLARLGAGEISPSFVSYVGGPNSPMPGGETETTLNLEPGNYAMVCIIPSPDGVPHLMKGMIKPLTVTPSTSAQAPEPEADVRMVLDDYSYGLESEIRAGLRTIRVENAAEQPHEVVFIKLAAGKSLHDVMQFMQTEEGPPPFELIGGTTLLTRGQVNYVVADFTPGEYGLLCMVPDATDGMPHIAHGMVQQITVH